MAVPTLFMNDMRSLINVFRILVGGLIEKEILSTFGHSYIINELLSLQEIKGRGYVGG